MKITYKPGKADKIHIYLDGEYSMTVDKTFVGNHLPDENTEIDERELAELTEAVSSRRAFNKACDLLEMRDHSSGEIRTKLRQKGYGDYAEQAIEKLIDYGYIDDERFARNYSAELIRIKHFGKKRIIQELYRKGISSEIISMVTEEIETDEDELVSLINRKYLRYLGTEKGVNKTINALLRMGYSFSEIRSALSQVEVEVED